MKRGSLIHLYQKMLKEASDWLIVSGTDSASLLMVATCIGLPFNEVSDFISHAGNSIPCKPTEGGMSVNTLGEQREFIYKTTKTMSVWLFIVFVFCSALAYRYTIKTTKYRV